MPTITHQITDDLTAVLTIEVVQNDYLPKVNEQLKEFRQKAQIKGFRTGKTPMTFIKRKFGNGIMMEEVNKCIENALFPYIKENKLQALGQPVEITETTPIFDVNKPTDYTIKFEIGIAPEFEVQGISLSNTLPYYEISVENEVVNKEIDLIRQKSGAGFLENITDIIETDMLVIDLQELDENGNIKEGGATKEGTYLALRDVANQELKDNLLTATIGDAFDTDIFKMEAKDATYVRKHILGVTPQQSINDMFRLTIKEIKRVEKAELNEEFFKKIFPNDDILTEEDFTEKVKEEVYQSYRQHSLALFQDMAFEYLMEQNKFEMPEKFLKKWLKIAEPNYTEDFFEGEGFQKMLKHSRWNLIREKLAALYDVTVTKVDIENSVRMEVLRYFNYQIPAYGEMMDKFVNQVLSKKDEIQNRYESLLTDRVLKEAAENIGKDMKTVSFDEFKKIAEERQQTEEENPVLAEAE